MVVFRGQALVAGPVDFRQQSVRLGGRSRKRGPGGFEIAGRIKFRNQDDAAYHFTLAGELAIVLAGLDSFLDNGCGW